MAERLDKMTASLAAALLAKISKPISDQCESLLAFKTLAPPARVSKTSERLALGH